MKCYLAILAVLFISVFLFGCCGSSTVERMGTPTPTPVSHFVAQTPTPASPVKLELNLGETATSNGVAITVKSAEIVDSYAWTGGSGSSYTQNAPTGKKYLIATVMVKNVDPNASRTVYASSFDFSATDSEGTAYDNGFGLMNDQFSGATLYQNQKSEGKLLFEINSNAQNVSILYDFGNIIGGARLAEWRVS